MASEPYSVGTVTVANGGTTVVGVDTFWVGKVRKNDMFFVPAQGLQARVTADPTDNLALAITPWAGTSLVAADYEIIPAADSTTSSARLRDLLAQMSVIEANGRGLFYRFSDSVTDADPSSGYLRLNNVTVGGATAAYIDNLDANGATVTAELDTWDDSTSVTKGKLWLRSIADPSAFHAFRVTGSVVDGTGYRKLALAYVGGSSTFAADDELMVFFAPNGDQGDGFITDAEVADPSELTAYETEDAGFLVMVADLETDFGAYSGRSGVVKLVAGPDWELVALYTGPQGVQGPTGEGERYDVVYQDAGRPGDAEVAVRHIFSAPEVTFLANLAGSYWRAVTAATATCEWSVRKNGVQFATMTFAAAGTTATLAGTEAGFVAGDILTIIAPTPRDNTLAGIFGTLAGERTPV